MKKTSLAPLLFILVITLMIGAWACPVPAQAKAIDLKFVAFMPAASPAGKVFNKWKDRVAEQSGGRLNVRLFMGGALASQMETFRALMTGITDMGFYTIGTHGGLLPLNEVTRLPMLGLPNKYDAAEIHGKLVEKFPEMKKELQGLKLLGLAGMPPEQMFFTKKEVRVPADIKGMKIIAGADWPPVLDAAGAAAMKMGAGDWYMSLERGLVEGHIINFLAALAFKTIELFKYHTMFGEGGTGLVMGTFLMNPDSWAKLPPDLQTILSDSVKWTAMEQMKIDEGGQNMGIKMAKDMNHTFTTLTPEEVKQWVDLAYPIHETWIRKNAGKGPTQAIYDEIQRLKKVYAK